MNSLRLASCSPNSRKMTCPLTAGKFIFRLTKKPFQACQKRNEQKANSQSRIASSAEQGSPTQDPGRMDSILNGAPAQIASLRGRISRTKLDAAIKRVSLDEDLDFRASINDQQATMASFSWAQDLRNLSPTRW